MAFAPIRTHTNLHTSSRTIQIVSKASNFKLMGYREPGPIICSCKINCTEAWGVRHPTSGKQQQQLTSRYSIFFWVRARELQRVLLDQLCTSNMSNDSGKIILTMIFVWQFAQWCRQQKMPSRGARRQEVMYLLNPADGPVSSRSWWHPLPWSLWRISLINENSIFQRQDTFTFPSSPIWKMWWCGKENLERTVSSHRGRQVYDFSNISLLLLNRSGNHDAW
jgi:hypothetical protein